MDAGRNRAIYKVNKCEGHIYCRNTSGFCPRYTCSSLRASLILGSLTRKTGRCAPPDHLQFCCTSPFKELTMIKLKNSTCKGYKFGLPRNLGEYYSTRGPSKPGTKSFTKLLRSEKVQLGGKSGNQYKNDRHYARVK
jgi:hypothetical protein